MTTHAADPYAILGVAADASDDDLDHAFRGLVRLLHPDTRSSPTSATSAESDDDADRRLQEILNAYATLRDPIRRAAYDRAQSRSKPPAPRPVVPDALVPDPSAPHTFQSSTPILVGPAIRIGPVHWEPPRTSTDTAISGVDRASTRRSHHGTH
jgi:curved DNA-binding protein CbpA